LDRFSQDDTTMRDFENVFVAIDGDDSDKQITQQEFERFCEMYLGGGRRQRCQSDAPFVERFRTE
jgi:hypothetical protein